MIDNIKKVRPSNIYFSLVFLAYVLTVFVPGIRTGMFAAVLMVAVFIETGLKVIKSDKPSDFISLLNITVFIYFIYNLLSFIWITKNGYPISIFVEEFSNSVLPIVFYFAAVCIYKKDTEILYKTFLYSFVVLSIVCIVLYVSAPQFYCDYLFNMSYISKADASTCRVRMEGVTGSTSLSYLGVAAMLVAAHFMYSAYKDSSNLAGTLVSIDRLADSDNKKTGTRISKNVIFYGIIFIFSLAVVFLANGRAGMVAALLVIVYINFLLFFTFKLIDKKYFYIELGIIAFLVVAMCIATPSIIAKIWARLVSLPGAIGQRSEQWVSAINNMKGQWFGNGLGANGHKAIHIEGAFPVPDGGLVKLYCEEGAIGFALYVYMMIMTFRKGLKNLKNCFSEIGIISTALLMSIGSNIIAFQLCMPIFFVAAGSIYVKCNGDEDKIAINVKKLKKTSREKKQGEE